MIKILAQIIGTFALMTWVNAADVPIAADCPTGRYVYNVKVVSVYDGDTITADVDLGFNTWRMGEKLRLYGIDTPEMRGDDKPRGTISRDWLRSAVLGKEILIESYRDKQGKYGRFLAVLHLPLGNDVCLNLNDEIVRLGLGVYREY